MKHYDQSSNLRADIVGLADAMASLPCEALWRRLTAVARQVRDRMQIEETILFTAIEEVASPQVLEEIATLRAEHGALRALLVEIERGLPGCQRDAIAGNLRELDAALRLHDTREAALLPPIMERLLDTATVVEKLARLDAHTG